MGLLDDAIREHLELKRRRGADATELERQEHEALGPARQREFAKPEGEAPAADAPPADEPEADAPAADEPADDAPLAEVPEDPPVPEYRPAAAAPAVDEPPPPVEEPPPPPEEEEPPPAAERPAEVEPWLDDPDEVPVDDALEHPAAPPEPDPDVVTPDPEPGGDDVLEETPDFLQETPEHDRLWFEQKPPRDFDFDK
jgi:hypothetical protein